MPSELPYFFEEQPELETERLRIREMVLSDAEGMYRMDSNPNVHRYLGTAPLGSLDEAKDIIRFVQRQYAILGIGRWSVEEKASGEFIGWSGFKWISEDSNGHHDYLDIGYRFLESHWGRGIASEAALACMKFAAESAILRGYPICGMVFVGNEASERVLGKLGLRETDEFDFMQSRVKFFEL